MSSVSKGNIVLGILSILTIIIVVSSTRNNVQVVRLEMPVTNMNITIPNNCKPEASFIEQASATDFVNSINTAINNTALVDIEFDSRDAGLELHRAIVVTCGGMIP